MNASAFYIVQVDSFDGNDTSRNQYSEGDEERHLFAIVSIQPSGAFIVDDGYRSVEEAAAAWPEAHRPEHQIKA